MAANQRMCWSYLLEEKKAIHDWVNDSFKLALYDVNSTIDPTTTTAYTATHEVTGTGYVAGGVALTVTPTYPKTSATGKVLIDFSDVVINPAAFATRRGLIYNASKANRAVAVIDFGSLFTATVSFSLIWPAPDDNNATIRTAAAA